MQKQKQGSNISNGSTIPSLFNKSLPYLTQLISQKHRQSNSHDNHRDPPPEEINMYDDMVVSDEQVAMEENPLIDDDYVPPLSIPLDKYSEVFRTEAVENVAYSISSDDIGTTQANGSAEIGAASNFSEKYEFFPGASKELKKNRRDRAGHPKEISSNEAENNVITSNNNSKDSPTEQSIAKLEKRKHVDTSVQTSEVSQNVSEIAVQTEKAKSSEVGSQYESTMMSSGVQTYEKKLIHDGCQTEMEQYDVFCQTATCIAQVACQTDFVQRKIYRDQNDQTDNELLPQITATAPNAVVPEMTNQISSIVTPQLELDTETSRTQENHQNGNRQLVALNQAGNAPPDEMWKFLSPFMALAALAKPDSVRQEEAKLQEMKEERMNMEVFALRERVKQLESEREQRQNEREMTPRYREYSRSPIRHRYSRGEMSRRSGHYRSRSRSNSPSFRSHMHFQNSQRYPNSYDRRESDRFVYPDKSNMTEPRRVSSLTATRELPNASRTVSGEDFSEVGQNANDPKAANNCSEEATPKDFECSPIKEPIVQKPKGTRVRAVSNKRGIRKNLSTRNTGNENEGAIEKCPEVSDPKKAADSSRAEKQIQQSDTQNEKAETTKTEKKKRGRTAKNVETPKKEAKKHCTRSVSRKMFANN